MELVRKVICCQSRVGGGNLHDTELSQEKSLIDSNALTVSGNIAANQEQIYHYEDVDEHYER